MLWFMLEASTLILRPSQWIVTKSHGQAISSSLLLNLPIFPSPSSLCRWVPCLTIGQSLRTVVSMPCFGEVIPAKMVVLQS
ncbi:hypothetical protein PVAG01_09671 [Phlyctema vagabunda]|uniref:Uncharacterized protein n=1 Tax=Phlyctema vagabunda TaxID=108571 RepID=A0ABR4P818_9HELO